MRRSRVTGDSCTRLFLCVCPTTKKGGGQAPQPAPSKMLDALRHHCLHSKLAQVRPGCVALRTKSRTNWAQQLTKNRSHSSDDWLGASTTATPSGDVNACSGFHSARFSLNKQLASDVSCPASAELQPKSSVGRLTSRAAEPASVGLAGGFV